MKKRAGLSIVAGLLITTAHATITFQYNFTDVGTGFNDPTTGAARRAALIDAGNYVSGLFVNYNATINLDVNGTISDGFTFAAADAYYNSSPPGAGFGSRGDVMVKILGGADPSGTADGFVEWNFANFQWELGSDFQAGEYDFYSTAVHELLHTTGFYSDIFQNGNDRFGNTPGTAGTWAPFDQYMADNSGALINGSFELDGTRWNNASVGGAGTNGLSFIGANAMAANGGNPIYLYSPASWEDGSSGSHLDDDVYAATYVMEADLQEGLSNRTVSDLELGMLKDIGYGNVIPEPSTMALISFVGIALIASNHICKRYYMGS